jgi:hypothetical protein
MACPWNLDYGGVDPATMTVLCGCREYGRYADPDCERDFPTGVLVV